MNGREARPFPLTFREAMDDSPEALLVALADPRAEARRAAVLRAVPALTGHAELRRAVRGALRDPVWCVREAAASAAVHLAHLDPEVQAQLAEMTLQDSSPHVRLASAVSASARIEPERDYGPAVRHRFERQRVRAAFALGFAQPERAQGAVKLLALAATDHHPKVRLTALRALARIEPGALLPVMGSVVRKCAEADPGIAAAAREVWARVLTAAEVLRPLAPYPGTADLAGTRAALEGLPDDHPLRRAWAALPLPARELTAARFAKHLAAVCERTLGT